MSGLGWVSALWILAAYLVGSIPTTYWIARVFRGMDLRGFGSGNLGATNLYRAMGWRAAVPAGLFDICKGAVPVLLAQRAGGPPLWPLLVGVAAVVGHVFSPLVGFKGGKGVATAAGVFLALAPLSVLVALVTWAGLLKVTGYVSLSSMVAAGAFAVSVPFLYAGRRETLWAALATFAFIVFTHRDNVRRLLAGTEARFGRPRPAEPS